VLYYFGDSEYQLGKYAWYEENSDVKTYPVGQKKPNNWGLYDMYGNVREWCEDDYDDYQNAPKDGSSWKRNYPHNYPPSLTLRVLRGGSWFRYPEDCRSASRNFYVVDSCFKDIGFRLAVSIF
jgi:formylglycine-generating enzyme required for sulfatase activity